MQLQETASSTLPMMSAAGAGQCACPHCINASTSTSTADAAAVANGLIYCQPRSTAAAAANNNNNNNAQVAYRACSTTSASNTTRLVGANDRTKLQSVGTQAINHTISLNNGCVRSHRNTKSISQV